VSNTCHTLGISMSDCLVCQTIKGRLEYLHCILSSPRNHQLQYKPSQTLSISQIIFRVTFHRTYNRTYHRDSHLHRIRLCQCIPEGLGHSVLRFHFRLNLRGLASKPQVILHHHKLVAKLILDPLEARCLHKYVNRLYR
jgi:hypothetical protein